MASHQAEIVFGELNEKNLGSLKCITHAVLPVRYSDSFFHGVLSNKQYARLAFYNDVLVGAISARPEVHGTSTKLYILVLGVLAPYRNLGIGRQLLESILSQADADSKIDEVYLHVQVSNQDAIDFYRKFGFEQGECLENYYKRITPADAFVLRKTIQH